MANFIQIQEIAGVFTNADKEDIPEKYATVLKNFIPRFGKLEKTFGFGVKIDAACYDLVNLITYLNDNLAAPKGSGDGYVFIGIRELAASVPQLYYWDGNSWELIDSMLENVFGTYKHQSPVPIIQHNKILRILPGNIGEVGGVEAKGIWIGYVDRDFFDGIYVANTDFDKGFYTYDTEIIAADIGSSGMDMVVTLLDGDNIFHSDTETDDVYKYYKFSFIYDGLNESLLSDEIQVVITNDKYPKFAFSITQASHNKRVTAIRIYRSEVGNEGGEVGGLDASYNHIHTIDLLRNADEYLNGNNADSGIMDIYIPEVTGNYVAGHSTYWDIILNGNNYVIADPTDLGTGQTIFFVALQDRSGNPQSISSDEWDEDWDIGYWNIALTVWTSISSNLDGAYAGNRTVIFPDKNFYVGYYAGAILFCNSIYNVIKNSYHKALHLGSDYSSDFNDQTWKLFQISKGLYFFTENGADVDGLFFDTNLDAGASYPLLNSPSIKVNGKFATVLKGRLFQYNVVLDPGDTNEVHDDWLSYSQYDQLDVNPVSNIIPMVDKEGGEGTGLGISFGSLILFKKHSILKLDIVNPIDPTTWVLLESVFQRGNVADSASGSHKGIVQVGDSIFFCAYDGIYRIDANMMAAADSTPLIQNRISEPINDVYLNLSDSEKTMIKGAFNQRENEIIWRLSSNVWMYNMTTNEWRQINSIHDPDLICLDENGDFIFCDTDDGKIYSANVDEAVGCDIITKVFYVSDYRKDIVRELKIRYKSTSPLTVNLYVDDSGVVVKTGTLAASSVIVTGIITFKYRCNNFKIEIIDSVNSTTDTTIYEIKCEIDN